MTPGEELFREWRQGTAGRWMVATRLEHEMSEARISPTPVRACVLSSRLGILSFGDFAGFQPAAHPDPTGVARTPTTQDTSV